MAEKEKSIGAFWKKQTQKGEVYLTGQIEMGGVKHNLVVFKNNYKKEDKHPDYQIYFQRPREQKPGEAEGRQAAPADEVPTINMDDGEVPF